MIIQVSPKLEWQVGHLLLIGNGCLEYLSAKKDSEIVPIWDWKEYHAWLVMSARGTGMEVVAPTTYLLCHSPTLIPSFLC